MKKIRELPVTRDPRAHEKKVLFRELVNYAKSKGLTVLIEWRGQKDCSTRDFDDDRYTSNGAYGSKTDCAFCGRGPVRRNDIVFMDGFVVDRNCYMETMGEQTGTAYLPATRYRAAMIIHQVWLPGSLDDDILSLAEMISCHELGFQTPSTSPKNWKKLTKVYAKRLLKRLWKEHQLNLLQSGEQGFNPRNSCPWGCGRYAPQPYQSLIPDSQLSRRNAPNA